MTAEEHVDVCAMLREAGLKAGVRMSGEVKDPDVLYVERFRILHNDYEQVATRCAIKSILKELGDPPRTISPAVDCPTSRPR